MDKWEVWSKYVLMTLESLDERMGKIENGASDLRTEIAVLKVKSGIWGGVGGSILLAAIHFLK